MKVYLAMMAMGGDMAFIASWYRARLMLRPLAKLWALMAKGGTVEVIPFVDPAERLLINGAEADVSAY